MCHIISAHSTGTSERQREPEAEVAVKDTQSHSLSASPSMSHSSSLSSLSNDGSTERNTQPHVSQDQPSHSQDRTLTNGEEVERAGEGSEGEGEESDTESQSEDEVENDQTCKSHEKGPKMNGYTGGRKIHTMSPSPPPTAPDSNGRVPTPILRETSEQMRHHLDRTTPTSGSVLTSPPLPAFLKSSRVPTSSRTTGNVGGTGQQSRDGVRHLVSTSHLSKGKKQGKKAALSKQWNSGLYLSRGSPKLKHDRSLVSSVNGDPRSSSHYHTLPKSTTSHPPKVHPPSQSPNQLSTTHHTLTTTHLPHSLSSVSSLLSSISNSSSPGAIRRLDYTANSRAKAAVNSVQPPRSKPHSHDACTSPQCDICGAWLRKSQASSTQTSNYARTSTQGAHFSHAHTHQYKGTVTQLSKSQPTVHPAPWGSNSNIHPVPQPKVATFQDPPSLRPTLRETDELSISSLSLSSCSVASDLLKKARERREKFWTQPNTS